MRSGFEVGKIGFGGKVLDVGFEFGKMLEVGFEVGFGGHLVRMRQALDRFFGQFLRHIGVDESFVQGGGTHNGDRLQEMYQGMASADRMCAGHSLHSFWVAPLRM